MTAAPLPDGLTPSKVVAVHLNYRSRTQQRGRVPAHQDGEALGIGDGLDDDGGVIAASVGVGR